MENNTTPLYKQFLTKEVLLAIIRHVFTVVGGILIAKGMVSSEDVSNVTKFATSQEAIGIYIIVGTVIKSAMQKVEQKKVVAALETKTQVTTIQTPTTAVLTSQTK